MIEKPKQIMVESQWHQQQQQQQSCAIGESIDKNSHLANFRLEPPLEEPPDLELGRQGRVRYVIALLGLTIAVVNSYAQANFNIAIVEMVIPSDYSPEVSAQNSSQLEDQSCPIEWQYRHYYDHWRFANSDTSTSSSLVGVESASTSPATMQAHLSDRFAWDAQQQGLLLGAFAIGTAPLQVIGGRLAEIYGAKWVLFAGCLGSVLTNLTVPLLARFSFTLLVLNRILMGISQCGLEPGLMCLLAEWLAPQETSFFISMLLFALCSGFFLGSLGSSALLANGLGWPSTFYVVAALNTLVGLIWLLYASSWPRTSRFMSRQELAYVEFEQRRARRQLAPEPTITVIEASLTGKTPVSIRSNKLGLNNQSASPLGELALSVEAHEPEGGRPLKAHEEHARAPWLNILTTRSVWAFIVCKISIRWAARWK